MYILSTPASDERNHACAGSLSDCDDALEILLLAPSIEFARQPVVRWAANNDPIVNGHLLCSDTKVVKLFGFQWFAVADINTPNPPPMGQRHRKIPVVLVCVPATER